MAHRLLRERVGWMDLHKGGGKWMEVVEAADIGPHPRQGSAKRPRAVSGGTSGTSGTSGKGFASCGAISTLTLS